jgi:hypothetical protein
MVEPRPTCDYRVPPFAVFTEPLALGAAAVAVAVPVLIHLLFRKRYQIVPWAAIRFLLVAERRHRRRIDRWLLLLLRVLSLLLPLLAMVAATKWAEPLWQAISPGAVETIASVPRTHHILVLDVSLSMTARSGTEETRLEKALAQAENLIRSGNPGDGYTLIVLSGGVRVEVPGPSNDAEKVVAELRTVKPTHTPADTAAALGTIAEVLARSPRAYPRRQVTFFTDLQRSAWANALPRPDAPQPEAWQRLIGRADVVVVDVARSEPDNLAVVDLALADPLPFVDSPGLVTAVIANYGRTEKRDVRLQLLLGRPSAGSETLVPVEQQTVKVIPPGNRSTVTFGAEGQVRFRDKGLHVLQVRLVEPDDLPADDSRALAVTVRDGLHALLVDGKPDPEPSRRAAWDLRRALLPRPDSSSLTPARPRLLTPAEFLDPTAGDLTGVDCVYLCDLGVPTPELAAKLDAFLRRGGGVVIGLGPNAAAHRAAYNRVFYDEGNGLLPGPLGELVTAREPDSAGFRLAADEEEYRKPPLAFFRDEKVRGGLIMAPFRSYLRLGVPSHGRGRPILSFVPGGTPNPGPETGQKPDPALFEWARHRGRVVVFTSSFNEDWNDWPPLPSYLMFHQEFLRFVATNPDRHTLRVGESIEEFYPPGAAGLTVTLAGPEGLSASLPLTLQDEAGVARFTETRLGGLYRLRLDGQPDRVFAVNIAESNGGGSESDLKRIEPAELRSLGPVQLVPDAAEAVPSAESGATLTSAPKPHGPVLARYLVMLALLVLTVELLMAWRWGPARAAGAGTASGSARPVEAKPYLRLLGSVAALVPLALAVGLLATVVHYESTGDLLGFLPPQARQAVERAAGVPAAQPGEGTKWRLEGFTAFVRNAQTDRRLAVGLAGLAVVVIALVYRAERRAVAGGLRLVPPGLLRVAVLLLLLFVVLPQLRLAFDREGWPEVVILIDTSASMDTADEYKDPAVRAKAEELVGASGLPQAHRLRLAQALLTRKGADWVDRLLRDKEVKVHIYAVDSTTRPVASAEQPADADAARAALLKLEPLGESSRLGEGVEAVLKAFRGGSLAGVVMFTDGITTAGDDLPKAAHEAARAGVRLYLVGVGDVWEAPDLELTDLQAEDTVTVGDRLVFDARLAARGQVPTEPLPVILYEKVNGQLVERGRQTVTPDPAGNRVPVAVSFTPTEPGEKTFVLAAPTVPGETDASNNRLERTVVVTDSRRVRVLWIEGSPRYDFRFAKVLMERESERSAGGKGMTVEVILLSAAKGWAKTDRSAFQGDFPTRDQLLAYDVVILGDVDPKQIPRSNSALQNLADFVKEKGGGLMFLSGEHGTPAAFADTPLADVLPVVTVEARGATRAAGEDGTATEGYRPRLTPAGRQHPLFRFSPDEAESLAIWNRLQPLYWAAKGYRRKPNTVVLAVHPDLPAEGATGENHPLVLQSFAGAGTVLFLGFDDTWRWRFRNDEEYFDRFWVQAVRVLSRSRSRRPEITVVPKADFRRDEKMTVVVRFPVESPAPLAGQPVRVTLTRGPLPNPDGTTGPGATEASTLTLARIPGPGVQYEATLTQTPEGEYRFTLSEPEPQPGSSAPTAVARVLPPLGERDRLRLNKPDLAAAAAISNGEFFTLADAEKFFDHLKDLQRVPLNQPCPPVELWNSPWLYLLLTLLLASEWLLRKRERLL